MKSNLRAVNQKMCLFFLLFWINASRESELVSHPLGEFPVGGYYIITS